MHPLMILLIGAVVFVVAYLLLLPLLAGTVVYGIVKIFLVLFAIVFALSLVPGLPWSNWYNR